VHASPAYTPFIFQNINMKEMKCNLTTPINDHKIKHFRLDREMWYIKYNKKKKKKKKEIVVKVIFTLPSKTKFNALRSINKSLRHKVQCIR